MTGSSVDREELHKAWLIQVEGFNETFLGFGSIAGKVRYLVYQDLEEAGYTARFADIKVKRNKHLDVMRSLKPDEVLGVSYESL